MDTQFHTNSLQTLHLQLEEWESRITKALHQNTDSRLKMFLEVRVWQTVAIKDEFQPLLCVDKHLMQMIAVVCQVLHLWQLTRKHLHLDAATPAQFINYLP